MAATYGRVDFLYMNAGAAGRRRPGVCRWPGLQAGFACGQHAWRRLPLQPVTGLSLDVSHVR